MSSTGISMAREPQESETTTYEIVIGPVANYKRVRGAPRGEGQDRVVIH